MTTTSAEQQRQQLVEQAASTILEAVVGRGVNTPVIQEALQGVLDGWGRLYTQSITDHLVEKLKGLGVEYRVAHYTGDSSYPTEHTLTYGKVYAVGPTFDLALIDFVGKLLKTA